MQPDWLIFDLDDTLYSPDAGVWDAIGERIDLFILQNLAIPPSDVSRLRDEMYHAHGTTLRGLQIEYGIDAKNYLSFVHDLPLENYLSPNDDLRKSLTQIAIKKCIFTNADRAHAQRVLKVLNLSGCFDQIIDILDIAPYCKPYSQAFTSALRILGVQPRQCVLFEDSPRNLLAACSLGIFTVQVSFNGLPPVGHLKIPSINDIDDLFSDPFTIKTRVTR